MRAILCLLLGISLSTSTFAQSNSTCIANADWGIFITDYGYAETMVDLRQVGDLDFRGREYLSGEWANAVAYTKSSVVQGPLWLEPDFLFPDWSTNSNFSVTSAIAMVGTNASGQAIYESVISNGDLEITIRSEMLDTNTSQGIQQGMTAASESAVEPSSVSSQYVLQQTLTVKNISAVTLTDIKLFQMLHGLFALAAVYDDRVYSGFYESAGPLGLDASHHYDTTVMGDDDEFSSFVNPSSCLPVPISLNVPEPQVSHLDILTLHTAVQPAAYENGYYGDQGIGDNHVFGKPSTGVHLSIESGSLNNVDFFDPGDDDYPPYTGQTPTFGETHVGDVWVAGAQQHNLGSLAVGQSIAMDYLLSVRSITYDERVIEAVPLPAEFLLLLFLVMTFTHFYFVKQNKNAV